MLVGCQYKLYASPTLLFGEIYFPMYSKSLGSGIIGHNLGGPTRRSH